MKGQSGSTFTSPSKFTRDWGEFRAYDVTYSGNVMFRSNSLVPDVGVFVFHIDALFGKDRINFLGADGLLPSF